MLKKNDLVKVIAGKNIGQVGTVTWFGVTRRNEFKICVQTGREKLWLDVAELQHADGSPVVVDEDNAPVSRAAARTHLDKNTRKRTVGDVRALEARVEALEQDLALLKAVLGKKVA